MQQTARTSRTIQYLVITIFLLTLADAACTFAGISLGFITEGNPILASVMQQSPGLTCLAAIFYTTVLLAVIRRFGHLCRVTVPLLAGLTAVKAAVIGMHVYWMALL